MKTIKITQTDFFNSITLAIFHVVVIGEESYRIIYGQGLSFDLEYDPDTKADIKKIIGEIEHNIDGKVIFESVVDEVADQIVAMANHNGYRFRFINK